MRKGFCHLAVSYPVSFIYENKRPKMLKERKDSNLDNVLHTKNCHILLITTAPDSSPGLFICQVTHSSAKEYLLCKTGVTFPKKFYIFPYQGVITLFISVGTLPCFPPNLSQVFQIKKYKLPCFIPLANIQLCRYDLIYEIIPLLNNT